MTRLSGFCRTALAAGALLLLGAAEKPVVVENTTPALTRPSEESPISFNNSGVVWKVLVKDGDRVSKDQLLITQDTRLEEERLKGMEIDAKSTLPIDFAKADYEAKRLARERVERMYKEKVAGESEMEEAKVAEQQTAIKVKQAEQEFEQKKIQAQMQRYKLEEMQIKAPFEGIVKKVHLGVGQVAIPNDVNKPAVTLVKNDPLWVETHLPTADAAKLKVGQGLDVQYKGDTDWKTAKIIYIEPEADQASDTQVVRMELANPDGRASGLQMTVRFAKEKVADSR